MLARYCGPGLLGLGITALIAGFMSGMAGNVSAFATCGPTTSIAPTSRRVARTRTTCAWALVHHTRRADQHRHRLSGHAVLSIMDYVQALFSFFIARCSERSCSGCCGSAPRRRRLLGPAGGTVSSIAMWAGVKLDPGALAVIALSSDARTWPRTCTAPCGAGSSACCDGGSKLSQQAQTGEGTGGLVYGCTDIPSEGTCPLPAADFLGGDRLCVFVFCRFFSGRNPW